MDDDSLDFSFDMSLVTDYMDDKKRLMNKTDRGDSNKKMDMSFNRFSDYKTNPHTGLTQVGILDSANNGIGDFNSFGSLGINSQGF
ncbi:hypothetical protein RRK67_004053 [Vibrio fluvialis]|nr:hypothetical protein [Vibrio fluvialis]